jgi:TRAP-type C4-dicarboxylate transport system permease small subunit
MWNIFISVFVIAAISLIFAHAWNMVVETMMRKYEKTDEYGNVVKPLKQILIYAICVTLFTLIILYYIYNYTDIKLERKLVE